LTDTAKRAFSKTAAKPVVHQQETLSPADLLNLTELQNKSSIFMAHIEGAKGSHVACSALTLSSPGIC
jgi:hypothetical protein